MDPELTISRVSKNDRPTHHASSSTPSTTETPESLGLNALRLEQAELRAALDRRKAKTLANEQLLEAAMRGRCVLPLAEVAGKVRTKAPGPSLEVEVKIDDAARARMTRAFVEAHAG